MTDRFIDTEQGFIRGIEDVPTRFSYRVFYKKWLEERCRRKRVIRRDVAGRELYSDAAKGEANSPSLQEALQHTDVAWEVRMGYLPLYPERFYLSLELPPTGVCKSVTSFVTA